MICFAFDFIFALVVDEKRERFFSRESYFFYLDKLQITPLKFGNNWILHHEVSKFRFYLLKFGDILILHPNISKFGFYFLKFWDVWILHPKVSEFGGIKFKKTLNFRE